MGLLVNKHWFCEQQSKTTHGSLILWRFPRHFVQRHYYFTLVGGGASYVAVISSNRCMIVHPFIAKMYPAFRAIFSVRHICVGFASKNSPLLSALFCHLLSVSRCT